MSGVILLMMGLVGEYIGRIYVSMNNYPQYVVQKEVGSLGDDRTA